MEWLVDDQRGQAEAVAVADLQVLLVEHPAKLGEDREGESGHRIEAVRVLLTVAHRARQLRERTLEHVGDAEEAP